MRRSLLLTLALAACGADTLAFDLVIEAPDCAASSFERVSYIELAVYGEHEGSECVLDQRCLWQVDQDGVLASLDDFTDALRDANQPLLGGVLEGATHVELRGRDSDCYLDDDALPPHPMCGGNDFDEVDDGAVPLVLTCEEDQCRRKHVELCP